MNFIEEFNKGQSGGNKGLPMGKGLINISNAINGIQKGRIYGIAGAPKTGKSTFIDYAFFIQPYLYCKENNIPIEWIYYSLEIDRISKEFDFATFFLNYDYGITHISLNNKITKDKKNKIPLDSDYLRGRVVDDNGNVIKVKKSILEMLKQIYSKRIIPIFGEYNKDGLRISKGIATFIEQKDNPTGIYKWLKYHAEKNGKFIMSNNTKFNRIINYKPDNPKKYTIVITDHLRKMIPERNFTTKQTVDKLIEYQVELRNLTGYTFVDIIHTNRSMVDINRLKLVKDMLYPSSETVKDTGNLSEDADYVFTLMNPNDDKYNLKKHFDVVIKDDNGNLLFPNMITIHLVESRHCRYPQHFKVNMKGNLKTFEKLKIN